MFLLCGRRLCIFMCKRAIFLVIFMICQRQVVSKKAVIEWSPNGEAFRDPMVDHAALVELHLDDRLVFVCDKDISTIIYKVSEKTFAECTYDLSAEWIGECSPQARNVSVMLQTLGFFPRKSTYKQNTTYFFTSFSSETKYGHGFPDEGYNLCLKGLRLILEVRDGNVRVPSLPRFYTSSSLEIQVPVQRVSYGGVFENKYEQRTSRRDAGLNGRNVIEPDDSFFIRENVRISGDDDFEVVSHKRYHSKYSVKASPTLATFAMVILVIHRF